MSRLDFTITFHGPFRVSLGEGGNGAHDTVDTNDALPSTSLKGVMRATAKSLLGEESPAIEQVFGSSAHPSPWKWSSAEPAGEWHPGVPAARVQIDEDTGAAHDDMLVLAEQTSAGQASFNVTRIGRIKDEPDKLTLDDHVAVLTVAAQATRSLGAWRRRGLGWVKIQCECEPNEELVRRFLELKTHA